MRLLVALCSALAFAASAPAAIVYMSGMQNPDAGAIGTLADAFDCTVTQPASDASAGICSLSATPVCVPHNGRNGGATDSLEAFRANTTGTSPAYCEVGNISLSQGTIGFSAHQNADPGAIATIMEVREGANTGCFVQENLNRTLHVCYNDCSTGIDFGTTAKTIVRDVCTGGSCTADADCQPDKGICDTTSGTCNNVLRPCTAATQSTDCPSGQTCATCSTATGFGCYHAGLELAQLNQGASVLCELWWDGTKVIGGAPRAAAPGTITAFRFGKTNATNGAEVITIDDIVISTDDRAGYGYVMTADPITDGPGSTCTADTCGTSSGTPPDALARCVDDWVSGGTYSSNTSLNNSVKCLNGQVFSLGRFTSMNVGQLPVTAIQALIVGRTGGNDTGTLGTGCTGSGTPWTCCTAKDTGTCGSETVEALLCSTASSCEYHTSAHSSLFGYQTATHAFIDRAVWTSAPDPAATSWTADTLGRLGMRVTATAVPGNSHLRIGGAQFSARVRRADQPPFINLRDHDLGTNDGVTTVCWATDSRGGNTFAVTCQGGSSNGAACSQDSYCSDFASTGDKPLGGCNLRNATCQTCQLRRSEFGAGAGYPCGPNNLVGGVNGTCNLGTCSLNLCSGDASVSCNVTADCNLGNCDTCSNADCAAQTPLSTCIEACPGGQCPTNRSAPALALVGQIGAANIVNAAVGSESLRQNAPAAGANYYPTRSAALLQGQDTWETLVQGSGAHCTCTVATATADCGAGGTCSGTPGVCTAGDATRVACQNTLQCNSGSGRLCSTPECDYVIDDHGENDILWSGDDPDCTRAVGVLLTRGGAGSLVPVCRIGCPTLACLAGSTCTASRSTSAACIAGIGIGGSQAGLPCLASNTSAATVCTESTILCNATADCPTNFTCTGGTPGAAAKTGYCNCGADADPGPCSIYNGGGTTYACRAGICTKKCTADSQCGTGLTCPAGSPQVCQRMCSCPCNSTDIPGFPNAGSCARDSDCPVYSGGLLKSGKCVAGSCRCCGSIACPDGTCDAQAATVRSHFLHGDMVATVDLLRAQLAALDLGDTDGGPVQLWTTQIKPSQPECVLDRPFSTEMAKFSQHLLANATKYPHVIDLRSRMLSGNLAMLFTDDIHPNAAGATWNAQAAIRYLNSLNVCATDAHTTRATALWYCKTNAGAWQSRTCGDNRGCLAGEVCVPKPCGACTCNVATQTTDCGSGGTCSGTPGTCTAGAANRIACVGDANCASGKTCSFADANCPASGDTCNQE